MSNLSMRLKQQARLLVVGVALSAATLAIIPGAAEATGTCGCPGSGDTDGSGGTTNTSTGNVGQVTLQDGADLTNTSVANNNNIGLNAPVLSPDSDQSTSGNEQKVDNSDATSGSGGSGAGQDTNTNTSTGNIGQVTGQDLVDLTNTNVANNNNVGVNAPIASPGSDQSTSGNSQKVDNSGASGSNASQESNTNTSTGNIGQVTGQDLVDLTNTNVANNNNVGVNAPVLSPDSDQKTSGNSQKVDNSGSSGSSGSNAGQESNTNTSTGNVVQVTGQDLVDLTNTNVANNNNAGLNAPIASPGSDQSTSGNSQKVDNSGSSGNGSAQDSNSNTSTGNVGQVTGQDLVDLTNTNIANNNNIGANLPVLSPGSDQSTSDNNQSIDNRGGGGSTPPGDGGDSKQKFNSGNGNGSEGGDPGNSGVTGANNAGGDEVGQEGGTCENPGSQNSPPKDNKGA